MLSRNEDEFLIPDYQALTPRERDLLIRKVTEQARAARALEMRAALRWLWSKSLRAADAAPRAGQSVGGAAGAAIAAVWRAYRRRRSRRLDAQRLHAMDDRMLKDIGLRRGEIEFVLNGADDPTRRPRPAKPSRSPANVAGRTGRNRQAARRRYFPFVCRNGCAGYTPRILSEVFCEKNSSSSSASLRL